MIGQYNHGQNLITLECHSEKPITLRHVGIEALSKGLCKVLKGCNSGREDAIRDAIDSILIESNESTHHLLVHVP